MSLTFKKSLWSKCWPLFKIIFAGNRGIRTQDLLQIRCCTADLAHIPSFEKVLISLLYLADRQLNRSYLADRSHCTNFDFHCQHQNVCSQDSRSELFSNSGLAEFIIFQKPSLGGFAILKKRLDKQRKVVDILVGGMGWIRWPVLLSTPQLPNISFYVLMLPVFPRQGSCLVTS